MLGMQALLASLELLQGIGIDQVFSRIEKNTAAIIQEIIRRDFQLLTPRQPELRAGIVTFRIPGADHHSLYKALMEQRVICAERGGGIRFSPHFHNTPEQIRRAFAILDRLG